MKSVALIGRGAIGSVVIAQLEAGAVPGVRLAGVLARSADGPNVVATLDQLLEREPDIVIEVASQSAAKAYGPAILEAGRTLMLLSVGAFADREFESACNDARRHGTGRLLISTGAIGGLDAIKAMAMSGGLASVSLHSRMGAGVLVQPWMSPERRRELSEARGDVMAFEGTARDAAAKFPRVANVAATLGLCSLGLDRVDVRMTAAADSHLKTHEIHAVSEATELRIRFENRVSPQNPRTSALTPLSILRFLRDSETRFAVGV